MSAAEKEAKPAAKAPDAAKAAASEDAPAVKPDARSKADTRGKIALVPLPSKPDEAPARKKRGRAKWLKRLSPGRLLTKKVVLGATFALMVALPVTLTTGYMVFIANDQYHSEAAFSVRSIDGASGSDILGMFTQASTGDTTSDSYILTNFIRSRSMVEAVGERIDLESVYAQRGGDWFFSMDQDLPIEDKVDYWDRMVSVEYDSASGIISTIVRAFTPEDATRISQIVLDRSELLINDLSVAARNEVVRAAAEEVAVAEERLREARNAIRAYRDLTQEVDPVEAARMTSELIGTLESELVRLRTELDTALAQMGPDSPRVRVMRTTIASLEEQIARERAQLGAGGEENADGTGSAGDSLVAARLRRYEDLQTQREFAEQAYASTLASLESARSEAARQQRYLAVFERPQLSEAAQYPRSWLIILLVALGSLFVWGMGVLGYYNVKDRA